MTAPPRREEPEGPGYAGPGALNGSSQELLVVKFGGSALGQGERVAQVADLILRSSARRKLVVVSAPGETTDQMLSLVKGVPRRLDPWEVARLLSLGERLSARLLTSVLRARGATARAVEPEDPEWPIETQGGPLGARPDPETTGRRARGALEGLLEHNIVVICGFLGTQGGRITTLGRGGSDVTAALLGRSLGAQEVLLVKDVPGILDADPGKVACARPLPTLSAEELGFLSDGGARVVAPAALPHLRGGLRLRVLPFGRPLDSQEGTLVLPSTASAPPGASPADGDPAPLGAPAPVERVGAVSALLRDWGAGMEAVRASVPPDGWFGLSIVPGAVTVFVGEDRLDEVVRGFHRSGAFRAVTSRGGLCRLSIPLHPGPGLDGVPSGIGEPQDLVGAARTGERLDLFVASAEAAFFTTRRSPPSGEHEP